ncbi:trehalose-phosphatase [Sphingomonas adhaesiva]|uniref:trehalose-phosphatase n=1 Tax=Sphingomonas adhaesiva TaxID=28212 RepID=UPI002FF9CE96
MSDPTLAPPPPDLLAGASLFLDFDGTLVEIADSPDAVEVAARVPALLQRLARALDGRVAIVTGRPVAEVRALLAPAAWPVAGSHGLEIAQVDGTVTAPDRPPALDAALDAAHTLARRHPGLLVEDKPFGVGLHYRRAPEAGEEAAALADDLAAAHDLVVQHGKMVVELRVKGRDKGAAVDLLMAEPARRDTRPVFMGDDVTDEAGFRAARALGGAGVLVGAPRDTAAGYRVDDVAAALAWLDTLSPAQEAR